MLAKIQAIKTAPAAASLASFAFLSFFNVTKSTVLSIAVLISSKLKTKAKSNKQINHSVTDNLTYIPAITTKIETKK